MSVCILFSVQRLAVAGYLLHSLGNDSQGRSKTMWNCSVWISFFSIFIHLTRPCPQCCRASGSKSMGAFSDDRCISSREMLRTAHRLSCTCAGMAVAQG